MSSEIGIKRFPVRILRITGKRWQVIVEFVSTFREVDFGASNIGSVAVRGRLSRISPVPPCLVTVADATAEMRVSLRGVMRARAFIQRGIPELAAAVERGWVRLEAAHRLSRLAAANQRAELVAMVRREADGIVSKALSGGLRMAKGTVK